MINYETKFDSSDQFYDQINLFYKSNNVDFMNHGYYPSHSFIKKEHMEFKNQLSLYLSLFDNINVNNINNKSILEIGCGRGGGIKGLSKYFYFKKIDACDLNKKNIEHCVINNKNNINFKISNAENLEYKDNLFDIVINVESSHCYKNPSLFFNEVKRVLKPNGIFLYTDVGLELDTIHFFPNFFYLFKNIYRKDITENVKNSCKDDIKNFKNLNIEKNIKEWLISIAENKYKEYSLLNSKYITYLCSDSDLWFNKSGQILGKH